MAKTITYGKNRPSEEVILWFAKHIGPRTHYLMHSVGGNGWKFERRVVDNKIEWALTVEDEQSLNKYEKMKMWWILTK